MQYLLSNSNPIPWRLLGDEKLRKNKKQNIEKVKEPTNLDVESDVLAYAAAHNQFSGQICGAIATKR